MSKVEIDFAEIYRRLNEAADDIHPMALPRDRMAGGKIFDHFDLDSLIEIESDASFCGLAARATALAAGSFAGSMHSGIVSSLENAKSPIEALLIAALWYVAADQSLLGNHFAEHEHLWVRSQSRVGRYTADIELSLVDISLNPCRITAYVECDGHDFHEKTKQQASKDKARDRAFQKSGALILRYSGSDIWGDPIGCAIDAISTTQDALRARSQ